MKFKENNNQRYILAEDADKLVFAFDVFTKSVNASLWAIYGPSLE